MTIKTDWEERAACIGKTHIMFPNEKAPNKRAEAVRIAKELCASCPVQAQCRNTALELRLAVSPYHADGQRPKGIWGGMTETERVRELERRKALWA